MWPKYFLTDNERHLVVPLTLKESTDLDYPEDFDLAEKIIQGGKPRLRPSQEYNIGDWTMVAPRGLNIERFAEYVGRDKFENMDRPLLITEEVRHRFASFLRFTEFFGGHRHFKSLEAYRYLLQLDNPNRQGMHVKQYLASQHYRLLRLPPTGYRYNTLKTCPDHHGLEFGTPFGEVNTVHYDKTHVPDGIFEGDILAWDRIVRMEDLRRQDFYVSPYEIASDRTDSPA